MPWKRSNSHRNGIKPSPGPKPRNIRITSVQRANPDLSRIAKVVFDMGVYLAQHDLTLEEYARQNQLHRDIEQLVSKSSQSTPVGSALPGCPCHACMEQRSGAR